MLDDGSGRPQAPLDGSNDRTHPSLGECGRLGAGLSTVLSGRRQLINLAHRFLGSMADAEDVAQETYAPPWCAMTPQTQDAVASPGGWLTTVARRICLDLPGSARAKRERYAGEWVSDANGPTMAESKVNGQPGSCSSATASPSPRPLSTCRTNGSPGSGQCPTPEKLRPWAT
ncbi:sigma factor [Streptomyces sp. NPDC020412]|uniref:sigma factor n=1 Tax=Streptomyces sp. NPDC020412 TaxID=3365073 RepID=UPI0037B99573